LSARYLFVALNFVVDRIQPTTFGGSGMITEAKQDLDFRVYSCLNVSKGGI
jgi:hypothetical protein